MAFPMLLQSGTDLEQAIHTTFDESFWERRADKRILLTLELRLLSGARAASSGCAVKRET